MSRRIPLVVVGAVLMALGALAAVGGLVLAVVFGSGSVLASGPQAVTTPTRALVSPMAQFDGVSEAPSVLGEARIEVDVTVRGGERGAFVGVAAADDVRRYLAGTDADLATDVQFQPFRITTQRQSGTGTVPPPATQDFWLAQAELGSGTTRLSWPVRDGDYRIVFMNADGSRGVDVDARFAFVLPSALRISVIVLATGLGTALLGGFLLMLGLLAPPSSGPRTPSAGAPPTMPAPAPGVPTTATTGSAAS
jgi:hypothetical protein